MNEVREKSSLHLKNFTEILVDEAITKIWRDLDDICKCEKCYYDTKAIALNNLPPKYTVTGRGELYTKLNTFRNQVHVDMIKEVMNAILIVSKNCSHRRNDNG
ncbi:MAG: late competence development ComFB family protein [Eubacteriales bacterium]